MSAPPVQLNRGSVTLTLVPAAKNGWEIRGQITQAAIGADWILSMSLFRADVAAIDDEDESATLTISTRIPYNEADSEQEVTAKVQAIADVVYDALIPSPAVLP